MKIIFCVECAAHLTQVNETRYDCPNDHTFWNNPKAAVGVVLIRNNKILVAKRGLEPRKGTYDLPGGFVDQAESIADAVKREILEETSIIVSDIELITSYPAEYIENVWVCDVIVLATKWAGEPTPQDDVAGLEWQPLAFLDSEKFTAPYPGFRELLQNIIN
jgi:ADP-ribose pyrophosphatase YjhB (NUDIX family)